MIKGMGNWIVWMSLHIYIRYMVNIQICSNKVSARGPPPSKGREGKGKGKGEGKREGKRKGKGKGKRNGKGGAPGVLFI